MPRRKWILMWMPKGSDTESFIQEMYVEHNLPEEEPHLAEVAPIGEDTTVESLLAPDEDIMPTRNASDDTVRPSESDKMDEDDIEQRTMVTEDGKPLYVVRESAIARTDPRLAL